MANMAASMPCVATPASISSSSSASEAKSAPMANSERREDDQFAGATGGEGHKLGADGVGKVILLCTYPNCQKVRENDRCQLCPYHEAKSSNIGWRQCKFEGCQKCRQGNTQFCKQHGGGRKCQVDGCTKLARGKMYCASHGGGKRCIEPNCIRMAVGPSGKCIGHGGGKRCEYDGCGKAAQYSWSFCATHAAEVRSNIKTSFKGLADALLEHGPDAPSESKKEEGSGV